MKISKKNMQTAYNLFAAGWKSTEINRIKEAYWLSETETKQIREALMDLERDAK